MIVTAIIEELNPGGCQGAVVGIEGLHLDHIADSNFIFKYGIRCDGNHCVRDNQGVRGDAGDSADDLEKFIVIIVFEQPDLESSQRAIIGVEGFHFDHITYHDFIFNSVWGDGNHRVGHNRVRGDAGDGADDRNEFIVVIIEQLNFVSGRRAVIGMSFDLDHVSRRPHLRIQSRVMAITVSETTGVSVVMLTVP
jgi:hypothetical protein